MLSGALRVRVHWLDWELRPIGWSMLSTWEDKEQSVQSDVAFLPPEDTDKAVRTPIAVFWGEPEGDALVVRPSLRGLLTLHLCKLTPIVFILLWPFITGFLQKLGSFFFLMMCIQKTDTQVPHRKKREKSSFCTLCHYCTFSSLHKIGFSKRHTAIFS